MSTEIMTCNGKNGTCLNLENPFLKNMKSDVLYHLAMSTETHDFQKLFGDVRFVCMGGTKQRMFEFALYMGTLMGINQCPTDLTEKSHRYSMYKVGPVLSVSHGIGIPSMTVLLQEVLKLLYYAAVEDPVIFRLGTSGGLHVPPGTVVVSEFGMSGMLEKSYSLPVLGKMEIMPSLFDKELAQELASMSRPEDGFQVTIGGTMAADDFYRGQGRTDGPFCDYTEEDKTAFLKELYKRGVRNIEMESTAFAAFTRKANVRSADVCVTLVDRMIGDQILTSKEILLKWQKRPMLIIGRYILKHIRNNSIP